MSKKESKEYFEKLMDDTQNKINYLDRTSKKLTLDSINDNFQKKNRLILNQK